ncbi:purple acid phosphatase family protein [Polyangium aurulentum]|uniref:purple acid phosphatase family protein n=1 Tax=Polyangium aurulentum TaxID=2567896 RepID=UPI0010AED0D4|nr:metallophosphoesterase family protein [Polyangium aurulentum]UQA59666.1 metallophosphoesterase family protein [Polyangium aurulentum]
MTNHRKTNPGRGSLLLLGSLALLAPACADDPAQNPPPVVGPTVLDKFKPEGCGFEVAPRPEYLDFSKGSTAVSAAPDIRRVRLGLGGNVTVGAEGRADPATSAGFAWQTDLETLVSEVQWGTDPDPAKWPAENRRSGVTWGTPAGFLSPQGDERMHEAYICGLTPATTYYYRVGGGPAGKEVWSEVQSFTTTPKDPGAEVILGVSGDARGQSNDAWRLIQRRMMKAGATAQLFSGDMIDLAPDQLEWNKWLDLAAKDTDGTPLTLGQLLTLSTHGNHENHTTYFYTSVVLPQDIATFPDYGELFFSVDIGPVHVVVVDDYGITLPQVDTVYQAALGAWLEKDLAAANANRANVPWIVAMHHHAEFSSSSHGDDGEVLRGREFFVPIWDKHHVDLIVAGHDHNYERSKPLSGPLSGATKDPVVHDTPAEGTLYMVCAGAGADPYGNGTSAFTQTSRTYDGVSSYGFYSFLKINKTSLTLESHELRADESDPVIDTITINK